MTSFFLAFIPLFVAIDPLGTIPLFISLTEGFTPREKKRLALEAVGTALFVGMTFGFAGHIIFALLGITPSDFRIAGGLLLLIISIKEIFGTTVKKTEGQTADRFIGVVPLGIPLIAGPAMMTTILILHDIHGYLNMIWALLFNLTITYFLLIFSEHIVQAIGEVTTKAIAKVTSIFLAAIGIMMIRHGIEDLFHK